METYWLWLIVGFMLLIAEMLTGTFYLVVLGVAAFVAALVAYLGLTLTVQSAAATGVAALGVLIVSRRRRTAGTRPGTNAIDVGQRVIFVAWVDEAGRIARVRYRDALWEARVTGEGTSPMYYIHGVEGSLLRVAATPP